MARKIINSMFPLQGKAGEEVETFIGPSVKVEGKFYSQGRVVVEGAVSGSLKTESDLKVGKEAKLNATVEARSATIAGEVRGNIKIKERLELEASAKIIGDVETKTVSIAEGAILQGKCVMMKEAEVKEVETIGEKKTSYFGRKSSILEAKEA